MPAVTIVAFLNHGTVARMVERNMDGAHRTIAALEAAGISMLEAMQALQDEGVTTFSASVDTDGQARQSGSRQTVSRPRMRDDPVTTWLFHHPA